MSGESSRPEVYAEDHFINQRKRVALNDRRPVIKQASDLVGPGIGIYARRITDYNDPLLTVNGFFSSTRAAHGPSPDSTGPNAGFDTTPYVAVVISDAEIGGVQRLTALSTGAEYLRRFSRNVTDPESIMWTPWISL